jgi:hypothetical protein
MNDVIAASHAEPPSSCGSIPSSSRKRLQRSIAIAHHPRANARPILLQPARLIDQCQLFLFLLRRRQQLLLLGLELMPVQLARLCKQPLPNTIEPAPARVRRCP